MEINIFKMTKITLLFLIISCCCLAEDSSKKLYLIITGEDKGAISFPTVQAGIVSFIQDKKGHYVFENRVQTFGENYRQCINFLPKSEVIVLSHYYDVNTSRIIDIRFPDKYKELKTTGYTSFSTSYKYPNKIIIDEFYGKNIDKEKGRTYSYDLTSSEIKDIDKNDWKDTLGVTVFNIKNDSLVCSVWGKEREDVFFLTKPHVPLRKDTIALKLFSRGKEYMYFQGLVKAKQENRPQWVIYSIKKKKWKIYEGKNISSEYVSFGDNFAIKNKLEGLDRSTGEWTVFISGIRQKLFLGYDSHILYISKEKLIFNDSSRLYECPIVEGQVIYGQIRKIADNDHIRYATDLFFRN